MERPLQISSSVLMYDDFVWPGKLDAFNKREQYKWHTAKCHVTFNTRGYQKKN